MSRFLALTITLSVVACGQRNPGASNTVADTKAATLAYAEAAPDVEGLIIDEDSAATSAARDEAVPTAIGANVKVAVQQLNNSVKAALAEIKTLIATEPTITENGARVWTGSKNGVDYKLTVKQLSGTATYAYRLDAKAQSASSFSLIAAGTMKRAGEGLAPGRGVGRIGIDLTAFKAVAEGTAAAITKDGRVFAAFRHNKAGAHLVYRLKDFRRDTTSAAEPISAYFSGFRLFKRTAGDVTVPPMAFIRAGGHLNVTDFADLAGPENEIVSARLRRLIGFGGWGRAVIRGGNLAPDVRRVVRECWRTPATGNEALALREVWDCVAPFNEQTQTYASCTLKNASRYPAGTSTANENPESPATRAEFRQQCFPDAAARLQAKLQELAANEGPVPEDPAVAEAEDEVAVDVDGTPEVAEPVENADANSIETATTVESFVE